MGRIVRVDLAAQKLSVETPSDDVYLKYLGGYGIGAYYLYNEQKGGVDALGPDNLLGFFTGVLTGTPGLSTNRYAVVAKSPKTGTWGDANSGGELGPAVPSLLTPPARLGLPSSARAAASNRSISSSRRPVTGTPAAWHTILRASLPR